MEAVKYKVLATSEYLEWYESQPLKAQVQITDRLMRIQTEGHFGIHKSLDSSYLIWELKWINGRRLYYAYLPPEKILLLLGGNKNGQDKDIKQARKIFSKTIEAEN